MSIESSLAIPSESSLRAKYARFFFKEEVPYGLALMRMGLPFVLFCTSLPRWSFTRELYSTDGALAPLAAGFRYPNFLPELPGALAVALNTAMLLLLLTSIVGWCTRFSVAISGLLFSYFGLLDCLSTMTKYTVIAAHGMLLLSVSQCGTVWSVDSWLAGRSRRNLGPSVPPVPWPKTAIWPQRLAQILVGVVYFGAGITKMHTPAFFSGDQLLYWMMATLNYDNPLGDYLTLYPSLIVMFCYITIVWEVCFLLCCWQGWPRRISVSLGIFFHVMTVFTLGLWTFCGVMVAIYLAFLNEADVQWLAQRLRRVKRRLVSRLPALRLPAVLGRLPAPRFSRIPAVASSLAFAAVLVLTSAGGVGGEYWLDPYCQRGPNGPLPLKELSAEHVAKLLAEEEPIRESDKFLSFDMGTTLVGGRLWNRSREFRQGQRAICEVSLNPPHADSWVECNLHDADNRLISRAGAIAPREMFHLHFFYDLTDALVPGDYYLVLRSRGQEIVRRRFTLTPQLSSPVAN
jgi:hypothetical protein